MKHLIHFTTEDISREAGMSIRSIRRMIKTGSLNPFDLGELSKFIVMRKLNAELSREKTEKPD